MTRVGFIGLGSQGAPMAERILQEGNSLTIWARRPESTVPFAGTTASVAGSPAELAASSDIVGICVVADADVEDVLLRSDGVLAGMAPGGLIVIHSTIHPETCRRLAARASAGRIAVVDAPVSGGGRAAAARQLLVMIGGADVDVARCRPVLETFANPVIHLGALGSGLMAKLLNNLVFTAQMTAAMDTFAFADQLGIDRAAMAEVLAHGSGGSRAAGILAGSGFNTAGLRGSVGLLQKDVGLMDDVAEAGGVAVPTSLLELSRSTLARLTEG